MIPKKHLIKIAKILKSVLKHCRLFMNDGSVTTFRRGCLCLICVQCTQFDYNQKKPPFVLVDNSVRIFVMTSWYFRRRWIKEAFPLASSWQPWDFRKIPQTSEESEPSKKTPLRRPTAARAAKSTSTPCRYRVGW